MSISINMREISARLPSWRIANRYTGWTALSPSNPLMNPNELAGGA